MDSPHLDAALHRQALRALARVNALSLVASRIWRRVRALAGEQRRPVRLLDVACGGGDVAVRLAELARRSRVPLEAHGCDVSPLAVSFAQDHALRRGVRARFFELDVVGQALPGGYDLVCSSLFLHHLSPERSVAFLGAMARAGRAGIVQDLARTRLGLLMAYSALYLTSRSPVARADGPRSVRAAFTHGELERLAAEACLPHARVTRCWPQRLLLGWSSRPSA